MESQHHEAETPLSHEMRKLQEEYSTDSFKRVARSLEIFLATHREKIRNFQQQYLARTMPAPVPDDVAIKLYILQLRSINPADEIKQELEEIEREIWYRSEQAGHEIDRAQVTREWCLRHAPGWRDHHVMFIIYVFEKNKERLLKIFR